MDPFLNQNLCIHRLVEEYEQHKTLIIAYDFDNTVYDYHNKGYVFRDVINALRECKRQGFILIVFTSCNDDRMDDIKAYLNKEEIPYDYINETPDFIPFKGRKVYYNLLLDDRAGLPSAFDQLQSILAHIRSIKATNNLTEIG